MDHAVTSEDIRGIRELLAQAGTIVDQSRPTRRTTRAATIAHAREIEIRRLICELLDTIPQIGPGNRAPRTARLRIALKRKIETLAKGRRDHRPQSVLVPDSARIALITDLIAELVAAALPQSDPDWRASAQAKVQGILNQEIEALAEHHRIRRAARRVPRYPDPGS